LRSEAQKQTRCQDTENSLFTIFSTCHDDLADAGFTSLRDSEQLCERR